MLLLYLLAVIPFVTYAMSGFGALYDRWELIIDMYIAFLVVDLFDELTYTTVVQKILVGVVYCILFVLGKKQDLFDYSQFRETFHAYGILMLTLLILMPLLKRLKKENTARYVLFLIAFCTIYMNWKGAASDRLIESLRERDAVVELLDNDERSEGFYRIENERAFAEPRLQMNISLFNGYKGTVQYFSVSNKHYLECFPDWDISGGDFNVYGLDQRSVLETMCSVKYFVVRIEYTGIVPYGFKYVKETEDGTWKLYENENSLPIAYAYKNICDIEDYHNMNGLEKQSMMLHAAAVEKYVGEIPQFVMSDNNLIEGDYSLSGESISHSLGEYIKADAGSTVTLTTQLKSGCENCLLYTGSDLFGAEISIENVYTKYGISRTPIVINLGTTPVDKTINIKLTFSNAIQISRKDLHVVYHDLSGYTQYVSELKKDTEDMFEVTTNRIYGKTDFENKRILCFSVPYMKGYHAAIDGKETRIYLVNDLFAGIEVPEGHHDIELYYITPGIKVGAAISIISLIIASVYLYNTIKVMLIRSKRRRC